MIRAWAREHARSFRLAAVEVEQLIAAGHSREWALYEASRLYDITEPALERELRAGRAWVNIN